MYKMRFHPTFNDNFISVLFHQKKLYQFVETDILDDIFTQLT